MAGRHDPYHDPSPSALIQSRCCAVNVNDRVLTFAIIAQVWTAGDDHRENGCPAHRPRGRAQLCGALNPGQGTAACPNCDDGARRSIGPIIMSGLRVAVQKRMSKSTRATPTIGEALLLPIEQGNPGINPA